MTVPLPLPMTSHSAAFPPSPDPLLTSWRERTLRQLSIKLRRTVQPLLLSSAHCRHVLTSIESSILTAALNPPAVSAVPSGPFSALSPASSTSPRSLPLSSTDLPTLLSLSTSTSPFHFDLAHLIDPTLHLTNREVAFASVFPTPSSPSFTLLPAQPHLLIGRLSVDPLHPQRLLLSDDTATLPCHVIHADVSLIGRVVLWLRWNLLLTASARGGDSGSGEGGGGAEVILELDASQAVLLSFTSAPEPLIPVPSSYQPYPLHLLTPRQMKLLCASIPSASHLPPQPPSHSTSSPPVPLGRSPRPVVHLRGMVVAKSPMVRVKGVCFYFVQLAASDDPSSPSVFLLLNDAASMRWYHSLHVDGEYLFSCLRVKAMALSGSRTQYVLVPITASSAAAATPATTISTAMDVFSAHSSHLPHHSSSSSPSSLSSHSFNGHSDSRHPFVHPHSSSQSSSRSAAPTQPLRRSTRTVSYIGVITRQVSVCVYELDHSHADLPSSFRSRPPLNRPLLRLYVTRYDCPSLHDGVGLRPGCLVHLHHVHRIYRSGRFLGLGCCARSHIAITAFSPLSAVCRPLHRHGEKHRLWEVYQGLNLPDTALFLDCMETLMVKWGRRVQRDLLVGGLEGQPPVLRRLLHPHIQWGYRDDVYEQILNHDEACSVAPCTPSPEGLDPTDRSSSALAYPSFPSLSSLFHMPAVSRALERLRGRLQQDSHSSTAWHHERISFDALSKAGVNWTAYLTPSFSSYIPAQYHIPQAIPLIDAAVEDPLPDVTSLYTGLRLVDSTLPSASSIDCVLSGEGPIQVGGLYRLTGFGLVIESAPTAHGGAMLDPAALTASSATPHVVAYLSVSTSDLDLLVPPISRPFLSQLSATADTPLTVYITRRVERLVACSPSSRAGLTASMVGSAQQPCSLPLQTSQWTGGKKEEDIVCVSSQPAPPRCQQTVDCSLHGILVTADMSKAQRVVISLRGEVLAQSPLIRSGQIVHLSACHLLQRSASTGASEERHGTVSSCLLSIDRSPAASDWVSRMQAMLPRVLSVSELLVCDVGVFGDGRADPSLYSFTGLVLEKEFRCDPSQQRQDSGVRRSHSAPMNSSTAPSFDLSIPGRLYLRVRDMRLPHAIDVYVPLSHRLYPVGVLPGAMIRVSGAVRKIGANLRLFMECSHSTELTLISPAGDGVTAPAALLPLVSFSSFPVLPLTIRQLMLRVRCRLLQIKQLRFSLLCLVCGRVVSSSSRKSSSVGRWLSGDGRCGVNGCRRVELQVQGQVQLDDGTAIAMGMMEGPVTWAVLGLPRQSVDAIRHFVGEVGELHYNAHIDVTPAHAEAQRRKRRAQRRRQRGEREEDSTHSVGSSEEEEEGQAEASRASMDSIAMRRQRLMRLFHTVPRARSILIHAQQLILKQEAEACRTWKRRRPDRGGVHTGQKEEEAIHRVAMRECGEGDEEELELLLHSAVMTTVKGVDELSCQTMKPCGFRTVKVVQCEEVRVMDEARTLLTDCPLTSAV